MSSASSSGLRLRARKDGITAREPDLDVSTAVLSEAASPAEFAAARVLVEEYAAQLAIDLRFQMFAAELEALGEMYGPPNGCMLIAKSGGDSVACGAMRLLSPGTCEMKRLYVRPAARGANLGRRIAERLIVKARELGHERMFLDTLAEMVPARSLYTSLGFRVVAPYYPNPLPNVVYMGLDLQPTN